MSSQKKHEPEQTVSGTSESADSPRAGSHDRTGTDAGRGADKHRHSGKKSRRGRILAKEGGKEAGDDANALQDKLLRLQADFENFRKRTLREKSDLYQRANEELISELLPVLDHVDLARASLASRDREDPVVKGFNLVAEQVMTVLAKFGLSEIDTPSGEFDHNIHEAISHLPSDDIPENHVMTQVRRGYMLGSNLLRAAQVVVSSGPARNEATSACEKDEGEDLNRGLQD